MLPAMRNWWPNRLLPALVATVAARIIYVAFAQGRISVLVVFGVVIGGLPTLYFMAVHAVGFVYALLGREPATKSRWFEVGWRAGVIRGRGGRELDRT